jgi:uncharacterized protein involved in propanediol utilization
MLKPAADQRPAGLARASAQQSCITHHGELIQGGLRRDGEVIPCLVSLPRRDRISTCRLELFGAEALEIAPRWKGKALRAARITLARLGLPRATGRLTLTSQVETGLGLGSSTADVVAAIRACASALGAVLRPEEIAAIAVEAELATDPLMFDSQALLFAPCNGRVLEHWGDWYPSYIVFSCNLAEAGTRVDTLSLSRHYSDEEAEHFEDIAATARQGFTRRDPAQIAIAATQSAILNQSRVPLARFSALESLARDSAALGMQVAHSGVVGGVLLNPEDPELVDKLTLLAAGWRRLIDEGFDLFRTEHGARTSRQRS